MDNTLKNKIFFFLCFGTGLYFLGIYLISYFQINLTLFNVFAELLTIPFLIAQIVLLFSGVFLYMKNKDKLIMAGILIMIISTMLTLGSILYNIG